MRGLRIRLSIAAAALAAGVIAPGSASAIVEALPGPLPPSWCVTWPAQCLIQTRNGHFALSTHMVRAGKELTGTVTNRCTKGNPATPCPIDWSYMPVGKRMGGCRPEDSCPSEWAGPDLTSALRHGQLQQPPTFSQWALGDAVPGWTGRSQSMQVPGQAFNYYGWPYPSSAPGSCA